MSNCKFCSAEIMWAVNRRTGATTPLDPLPDSQVGNLLVDEWSWTFVQLELPLIERALARRQSLYVNHLTRCPNRPDRRPAQSGAAAAVGSQ